VNDRVCDDGSTVSACGVPATASGYACTRTAAVEATRLLPPGGCANEGTSSLEKDQKIHGTSASSSATDSGVSVMLLVLAPH
jgi:hypothetical protein